MSKKDPAFLFYSKDWIEGTAELSPSEKGIYIDLLCHQHQSGSLPEDITRLARITRTSLEEFSKIWQVLSSKFIKKEDRLYNKKLTEVTTERLIKGRKNTISGTFAGLIKNRKESYFIKESIKKCFKLEDFTECPSELLTERLTEWYEFRLKVIVNENIDGNNIKEEGVEETIKPIVDPKPVLWNDPIVLALKTVYKSHFPTDNEMPNDNVHFLTLANHAVTTLKLPKHNWSTEDKKKIILFLESVFKFASTDGWFSDKQLSFFCTNYVSLVKKFNKPKINGHGKHSGLLATMGTEEPNDTF